MINKFYKTIHNKYSKFFRFVFFLRYLFLVFFVAVTLFLFIPYLFNYENRAQILKNYLIENYDIKISKYEKIKYSPLPSPKIELQNVFANIEQSAVQIEVKNLTIYPKLLNIYNYENFQSNKIYLKETRIVSKTTELQILIKKLINQKNKLYLKNLDLIIEDENKSLVKLKNIKFANFGYQKNIIEGEVFDKKFKINTNDNFKNINFKLLNSGVNITINFEKDKNDYKEGIFKSKILNTNLKFDFIYNDNKLDIYNSYFRSKNISLNNKSKIIFKPFFEIESKFEIEDINLKNFPRLQLDKIFQIKEILKQINFKNELNFTSKKFSLNQIEKMNIKTNLAYGRLNFSKQFSISNIFLNCEGNLNLLEDYPLLFFECNIFSKNKKTFFKKFNLSTSNKEEAFNLGIKGNLSTLNKKINLKKITFNEDYKASKEDLKYFKETFENIVLDRNLLDLLNLKKIKAFIIEVS